jgi:hypothetical protein
MRSRLDEREELDTIHAFLNIPSEAGVPTFPVSDIITLHSEPLLDTREHLLVGGKAGPHEAVLLQDYLRLFARIIPTEDVRPFVGQLIRQAIGRILDDPDTAQSDLESLTTYCADLDAYRALLKLYLVRKAPTEKLLATASLMWKLSDSDPEKLIVEIVRMGFSEARPTEIQRRYATFGEEVWRATGMSDIRTGMTIVGALLPDRSDRAVQLLLDYIGRADPPDPAAVTKLVEIFTADRSGTSAFEIVNRFKSTISTADFHTAWARLVAGRKDAVEARKLLDDTAFQSSLVRVADPATLYRLLKIAHHPSAGDILNAALEEAVAAENTAQLRLLAEVYYEEGNIDEFEVRLANRLPSGVVEDIIESAKRRLRRFRGARWQIPAWA